MRLGEEIPIKDFNKWIEALRSGKYPQTVKTLQDENGYCCLGVACEILIPPEQQERDVETGFLVGATTSTQPAAPTWLTLINRDIVDYTPGRNTLWRMNDTIRWNFHAIADALEEAYRPTTLYPEF